MKKLSLFPITVLVAAIFVVIPVPVFADPPVFPPNPDVVLPKVFCIRITDIRADKTDPENNKFTFEFEVLNWSNGFATDVHFSLALPDSSGVRFMGAGVDTDGRPLIPWPVGGPFVPDEDTNGNGILDPGEDVNGDGRLTNDLLPGKPPTTNDWFVDSSSDTNIVWQSTDIMPAGFEISPIIPLAYAGVSFDGISPLNIIGSAFDQTAVNDLLLNNVPGITSIDAAGNVLPLEAIDNGFNSLDGFTFTVDGFDDGETFQINWFLTSFGSPIGTSFGGNDYGFGVINFARADDGGLPVAVFSGNTGFQQSGLEFYDSVHVVPDPAGVGVELAAGVTAAFLNPLDNTLGAGINFLPRTAVGGDMIQIETTSVLAAGAQYTAAWMIPVLVSAIGIGIVIARKF